jgi:hypothetical protein
VLTRTGHHNFYADATYVRAIEYLTGYVTTPVQHREPTFMRPADATVRGGEYGDQNFGDGSDDGGAVLMVKDDTNPSYDRETFLRFDLAGYERGHGRVQRARLRLTTHDDGGDGSAVQVRALTDDTWGESSITWDNRPTSSTALTTWPSHIRGATRELDVTSLVNQILADPADSVLSLRVVATEAGNDVWIQYGSGEQESTSMRPALVLESDSDAVVQRDQFTFGDSGTTSGSLWRSARTYSAGRFGATAAANAGWSLAGVSPEHVLPLITAYVLTTEPPRTGTTVPSRIYAGAGAWFHERGTSPTALSGALWNATKDAEHQHKDTNALHLTAYGEHVLRNAGYNGTGDSGQVGMFGYALLRGRAVVNNTVLIDYNQHFTDPFVPPATNDHALKHGAGVVEGFTSAGLDYASGDSGAALPNGQHTRNFLFVQPTAGAHGYWVVFDEVDAITGGVPASVAWHPNAEDRPEAVSSQQEYGFHVGPYQRTGDNVKLTVFFGTAPTSLTTKWGPLGDRIESHQGQYLYASYGTDPSGRRNIVTVLFPHDDTHAKASMTRLSGAGYTGAIVAHPAGSTDYALESAGATTLSSHGATWRGLATHFRVGGGDLVHYLVRMGRSFRYGEEGFSSSSPVSVHLADKVGRIVNRNSGPVAVTLRYPGISGATLNGSAATVISAGPGWVTINVPPGSRTVDIIR